MVTTWSCCCISGLLLGVCYSHLKPWGGLSCKKAVLLCWMDKTLSCPRFPFWSGAFAVIGQTAWALLPGVCRRGTEGSLRTGFPFQNVISFTISVSVYLKGTVTYWNAGQWGCLGLMLHVSLASCVHNDGFWKGVSLMEAEGGDGCQQGLHGRELWSQRTVLYCVVLGVGLETQRPLRASGLPGFWMDYKEVSFIFLVCWWSTSFFSRTGSLHLHVMLISFTSLRGSRGLMN